MRALAVFGTGLALIGIGVSIEGSLSTILLVVGVAVCVCSPLAFLLPKDEGGGQRTGRGSGGGRGGDAASQAASGSNSAAYQFQNSPVTIHASPTPAQPGTGNGDPQAALRRAIADGLTELDAIGLRLAEAGRSGRLAVLPADYHQPLADLLIDAGWVRSRRILDDAYNACDALRHRLDDPSRRWDGAPFPEMIEPRVEPEDDLPGVTAKVNAAIADLQARQEEGSGESKGAARVTVASVEVGEGRQMKEPNIFHEDWTGFPVVFNLVNGEGGDRALAVRPTVTVTDRRGSVLAGPVNARWSTPLGGSAGELERDIPANGAPVAIDTVVQELGGGRFRLITEEGLARGLKTSSAIEGSDLQVTLSIQGENFLRVSKTVRVRLGFPTPAIGDGEPTDTLLAPPQDQS